MELNLPGIHNKKNASCAIAVADCINIEINELQKMLLSNSVVWQDVSRLIGELENGKKFMMITPIIPQRFVHLCKDFVSYTQKRNEL
jgi:hypothetical protein